MKKRLILRNEDTGKYFTNDYRDWWSRDISLAFQINEDDLEEVIKGLNDNEFNDPLEGVDYIEVVVVYCR